MQFDNNLKQEINSMDDNELRKRIENAVSSIGLDSSMIQRYLSDIPKIKKAVGNLTQQDFDKLKEQLGEDTMNKIISNLKGNKE